MPKFNFYFEVDDKGYYITPHPRWNPVMTFTPYFIVEDGEAFVQMAFKSCDASRPKDVQGYVPSLWSVVLTHAAGGDEETATFYKFGMAFYSIEEIQGLIDALDISNELQELKEKEHKEQKEKEEIDKLFK